MPFHSLRISFQFDNYTHVRECKEVFQGVVTEKQPFRAFMFSFSWKSWLCLLRAWKNINQKRGELQNYFEAQLSLWNALARQSNAYQISAFCLKLQPHSIWVFICHRSTYFRPFGQWPLPILGELKPHLQLRLELILATKKRQGR